MFFLELKITGDKNEIADFLDIFIKKNQLSNKKLFDKFTELEDIILENQNTEFSTEHGTKILRSRI